MARRSRRRTPSPAQPLEKMIGRRWRKSLTATLTAIVVAVLLLLADRFGLVNRSDAYGPDWPRYEQKSFSVVHVVDGDTLDVDQPDGKKDRTRIRLWGIDTPEMNFGKSEDPQPYAVEATTLTKSLADGRTVRLDLEASEIRDRYGRLLAYIWLPDGRCLNEELVRAGLARADRRFAHPRMQQYIALEQEAKREHLGMWEKKSAKKQTDTPEPTATQP
ncbi:MAG: thermonuclease family protein [Phycisphaeraceae bacterium]|nr:thermonuclease family protein [Phycisphaeraceae bacterium]